MMQQKNLMRINGLGNRASITRASVSATEANTRPAPSIRATLASTTTGRQSHRSAQPAPQESEPTAESENKQKAVSTRANARITCIIRRKRWDRANHERQSALEQNEKV